jgi:hypothetical protein
VRTLLILTRRGSDIKKADQVKDTSGSPSMNLRTLTDLPNNVWMQHDRHVVDEGAFSG